MNLLNLRNKRKRKVAAKDHPISESEFARDIVLDSYEDMFGDEPPEETIVYDMDGKQVDVT